MRDIVGHLLESVHERLDALKHCIEVRREPIELVARARDRQPAGEIAVHDLARRLRHRVHALEDPSRHKESAGDTEDDDDRQRPAAGSEHDVIQAFPLFEIAPDQETKSGRQLKHPNQGMMLRAIGIVQAPVGGFGPARRLENARGQRSDIAGQSLARARSHEIKARARPTRPRVDDKDKPADTALAVLLGQAGDLGINRLRDLLGDQPARVPGEIREQEHGKQREHSEVDQRQPECRRAQELAERRHPSPRVPSRAGRGRHVICCRGSYIPRREPYAAEPGQTLYQFSSVTARCARR